MRKRTEKDPPPPAMLTYGDPEVDALALAYGAIVSQPREAWARMVEWLDDRIACDLEKSA